jgi:hypothetical protein
MTDLTKDAPLRFWPGCAIASEKWVLDNAAAYTIYKGQPMVLDVSSDTVYVVGYVDALHVDAADIFIGIAAEQKSVKTTDTETDNKVEIYTWPTIIGFKSAVYTDADVGDPVYMSDSAVLSATATDNVQIGKLHRVEDGYAYVQLVTPFICASA